MQKISRRDMLKMIGLGTAGTVLAACTPQATAQPTSVPATATTAPAKTVKITMVESWFSVPQDKAIIDPVTKVISDKMKAEGLNIEVQSMVLDDHQNKYPLLYASGADFTMAFDAPWYKMDTLRTQGSLVVLDDLFNQYGKRLMAEVTDKILSMNKWDGHWYGIPTAGSYGGTCGVILRKDLLDKYGAPEPDPMKGWPSLEPYLAAIAKNEPSLTPFAVDWSYSPVHENFVDRRQPANWNGVDAKTGIIIPDISKDYKLVDIEGVQAFIDTATLLRTWWEKGYINKTDLPSSGPTANLLQDEFLPGKAACIIENEPNYKYVDDQKQILSSIPTAVVKGNDMSGVQVGRYRPVGALKQWNFVVFNASAPAERQQASVKWFDWLVSSQDNIDLWLMGIDGTNYKKEADLRFSEVTGTDAATNYRRQWYVSGVSGRFQRVSLDIAPEALSIIKANSTEANWVFNPYEGFSLDAKAVEDYTTKVAAIRDEAGHGMYSGQMDPAAAVAKYKKMLDEAGRQKAKEIVQKQIDDYIASLG